MRILVMNYEYPPLGGGGAPVTASLCEHLAARGHDLDVVTMGFPGLPACEDCGKLRVHRVPCLRRRKEMSTTREMASYLRPAYRKALSLAAAAPYDLIHAHFIVPTGVVATAVKSRLRVPLVITAHGSDVPHYNPHRFRLEHRLIVPVWRWVLRAVDALVSPSQSLLDLAVAGAPQGRLPAATVLPHGVSTGACDPSVKIPNRVLMSGRLLERKGFRVALEALRDHPLDLDLHIIGDGPDRELLMEMARELPMPVTFHGWLDAQGDEYRDLFRTGSIFLFPTEMENFPVVLLEAMAAGLAIITTNAGGCGEVVGDTADIVSPRDPAAVGQALDALLHDPERAQAMGRAAYRRAVELFTWEAIAERYEGLFREAIARYQGKGRQ